MRGNEIWILLFGKLEQKDHLKDPGIEGWKTLKLVKKQDGRHGLE